MARNEARGPVKPRGPAVAGGMGAVIQPPTSPVQTSMGVPIPGPPRQDYVFRGPGKAVRPTPNGTVTDGGKTPEVDPDAELRKENERLRILNESAALKGVLEGYNLASLYDAVVGFLRQGYDSESVMALIRTTPEYKARFPAMDALAKKGRAISEAEYVSFESNAARLERAYGLPAGLLGQEAVTSLLTNEVSAQELEQRVVMAADAAYSVSPAVRNQFKQFYGVDSGGLAGYFLDPTRAQPLLTKQYVASQLGAEAAMQNMGIGVAMAETLQEAGLTAETARPGFTRAGQQQAFTQGRGDVVTQEQLIGANLLGNTEAISAVERAAQSRVGAFEGGGRYVETDRGVSGLGSAATR